jgi:hypothetical protein
MEERLFKKVVNSNKDVLIIENKIRELLQCESCSCCSFLQSTPYKQIVMMLLLHLNGIISFEEEKRLTFGSNSMILVMNSDIKTVEILKKDSHVELDEGRRKRKYHRQSKEDSFIENIILKRTVCDG